MTSSECSDDVISDMPAIVTDKIFKHLPISIAAKTSILSKTWMHKWLSCPYLIFDIAFWDRFCKLGRHIDWQIGSRIINNVLFQHNGSIHSFHLAPWPSSAELLVEKNVSLSKWLSLISRTCPKKIILINCAREWSHLVVMPSYIFHCTELTRLELRCFVLNAPPFGFKGFPHLKILELYYMKFNHDIDILWSWIAKCPCLVLLTLENCLNIDVLDTNTPAIGKITIKGAFDSLHLKKATRLIDVSFSIWLHKLELKAIETVVTPVKTLASSQELQFLEIGGCSFWVQMGSTN